MKKILNLSIFSLILILILAGCVTTSYFTHFTAQNARSINTSYDMLITSNEKSISKVYKLTSKTDGAVFYAISNTDWIENDINAEELNDFVVITKDNAKDLIAFIDLIASTYQKKERKGNDGVLYDIAIVRDYTYKAMTVDGVTTSNSFGSASQSSSSGATGSNVIGYGSSYGYGSSSSTSVSKSMKTFEEEDELVRIQLKTVEDEDKIIFAIAGYAEVVSVEDLQTLKDALSK